MKLTRTDLLKCLSTLSLLLLTSALGWSQESRGAILGRVTDDSGAAVPSVPIKITNLATGITTLAEANEQGNYAARFLIPGQYRISAEKSGFKRVVREDIVVRINDQLEINLTLSLGEVSETINVTSEVPPLQSTEASVGQVVDSRRVAELPVPYGNPNLLMKLSPGANRTANVKQDQPWEPSNNVGFNMAGTPAVRGEFTLDGSSNTYTDNGTLVVATAFVPPTDAVSEVKVQTATFDVTTGQTLGPVVNVSLKSGTNTLHGTGYYSVMPTFLTANDFFANRSGAARPTTDVKRGGFSLTGPVLVPKLCDGRNRTFFMYALEKIHSLAPRGSTITIPTPAEVSGDFSNLLRLNSSYQIYDPATRRAAANGRFTSDPFPGNVIPTSRINPISAKLLSYYPKPNASGTADGTNNLVLPNEPEDLNFLTHTIRVDHSLSDKHRVFGRYNQYRRASLLNDWFDNEASGLYFRYLSTGGAFDDVYMFSPSFLMNLKVSLSRFIRHADHPPSSVGFDATKLGFPASVVNLVDPGIRRFPHINIEGYWPLGLNDSFGPGILWRPVETRQIINSFSKTYGSHNFKFGGEFRVYIENQYNYGLATRITQSFDSTFTRGPFDNSPPAPIGQGLSSMLLGRPTGGAFTLADSYAESSRAYGVFFQDDWKATRRLSLNLGLRYELESPVTERYNRTVRGFDAAAVLPISAQAQANYARSPIPEIPTSQFKAQGGVTFAGAAGQPRTLFNRQTTNLMPRIGAAYSLSDKTVLRGGYGLYFGALGIRRWDVIQTGFSQDTPLVASLDGGVTYRASIDNPFPDGVLQPARSSRGAATNLGQAITYFWENPKSARNQVFQFGIQRATPGGFVVEVVYIGSRTDNIQIGRNFGAIPNQYLSTSPVRDQATINNLTTNVPNPFAGLLPGTGLNGSVISKQQLLSPYPQFTSVNSTAHNGQAWYNGLVFRTEKRLSNGLVVQASYTRSKLIEAIAFLNAADPNPVRAISNQDFPNNITASWVWEMPFGRGRTLLSSVGRVADSFVGGWQVSGIYTFQSGPPLGFGNAILTGDKIALSRDERKLERWFNTNAFNRVPAQQLQLNLITLSPRFSSVRGPGYNWWDISVIKNVPIAERVKFQFRAECLNALNQVNFAAPNTSPTNSAFGTITAMSIFPRRVQLNMKVIF